MPSVSTPGATSAPSPETLRRARVLGRVSVPSALAEAIAFHAYGEPRRGDVAALAAMTVARCAAAGMGGHP